MDSVDRVERDLHASYRLVPAVLDLTAEQTLHLRQVTLEFLDPFVLEAFPVSTKQGPEQPFDHVLALDGVGRGGEKPA